MFIRLIGVIACLLILASEKDVFIVLSISGQKYWPFIIFVDTLIPGCTITCILPNIELRNELGTNGYGSDVKTSHNLNCFSFERFFFGGG